MKEIKLGKWIDVQAQRLGLKKDAAWHKFYTGQLKARTRRVNQRVVLVQVDEETAWRAKKIVPRLCECGWVAIQGEAVCKRCRAAAGRGRTRPSAQEGYVKGEPRVLGYEEPRTPSHVEDMLNLINEKLALV